MANTERKRKFDFYNENIMLNIANGPRPYICTFPTPLPSQYLLPLIKHSNSQKLDGGPLDLEPVSDRKV
jgi:hypothetical protein